MTGPQPSGIRIGNDERAAAMKALDEHMSAGRLDPDEYGQRVAQASVARTREGIDELFVDLPAPHPFAPPEPERGRPVVFADRVVRRYAGDSTIVKVAMLILAAVVFLAALPFLVVGLVLIFVVLPIVSGGAWHAGRRWRGRTWRW